MTIKKFYSSSFAPNPLRINFMLKIKGVDLEYEDINIREGEQKTPEFLAVNPDGTVPVLVLEDDTTLCDTIGIIHYIEKTYPSKPLMGTDTLEQAKILSMMHKIYVSGSLAVAEAVRNGYLPGFEGRALPGPVAIEQIPELVGRGQKRVELFYQAMNDLLQGNDFLVNNKLSQADIDLFVCCNFANFIEQPFDAQNHTNLAKHFNTISTLIKA